MGKKVVYTRKRLATATASNFVTINAISEDDDRRPVSGHATAQQDKKTTATYGLSTALNPEAVQVTAAFNTARKPQVATIMD